MICHTARAALSVQADDELMIDPLLTTEQIDRHVVDCSSCQAFVESTRHTRQMLRLGTVGAAPNVIDDVLAQLPKRSHRQRRLGQSVVVIAAVGAVFVAGSALQRSGDQFGDVLAGVSPPPLIAEDIASFLAPVSTEPPLENVHVVWDSNLLTRADTDRIASHEFVTRSAVAALSTVEITAAEAVSGPSMVEVLSFDPSTYSEFVPGVDREAMSSLAENEAVVAASAATNRGLDPGTVVTLSNGVEVLVTAVVPDGVIADADLALVDSTVAALGAASDPFVLIDSSVAGSVVAESIAVSEQSTLVVVERAANASRRVAPKLYSSQRLDGSGSLNSGPRIVRSTLPLLGEVECRPKVVRALTGAMNRLVARGLSALIDPDSTIICFDPERTPETSGHWHHDDGRSIDINLTGAGGDPAAVDRRLIRILSRFGFDWGGDFLLDQPSHFEFVGSRKADPLPPSDTATVAGDIAAG